MKIRELVQDENDKLSSSRVVLVIMTIAFAAIALADGFEQIEVNPEVWKIMQTVFAVTLGGQAISRAAQNVKSGRPQRPTPL